jgi:hypothetical protein
MLHDDRIKHLREFYSILDALERKSGGSRRLAKCSGRMAWPARGIYFFREQGERRSESGEGPRVVRVGTHALKARAGTSLWSRLCQHKGRVNTGGGNHRGSICRLIVGSALIGRYGYEYPTWGKGNTAPPEVRMRERPLEQEVGKIIGEMPFLWLAVEDEAGPETQRGYIERNSIALLSNYGKPPLDPPSAGWLGRYCDRERVRESGLWNSNHVEQGYDPAFLDQLHRFVADGGGLS